MWRCLLKRSPGRRLTSLSGGTGCVPISGSDAMPTDPRAEEVVVHSPARTPKRRTPPQGSQGGSWLVTGTHITRLFGKLPLFNKCFIQVAEMFPRWRQKACHRKRTRKFAHFLIPSPYGYFLLGGCSDRVVDEALN